ncbi:MAG TPA: serine hydrolase domain-containing protein [Terriglobales bacterium]|nr:serine hydrolase domain-containing protein [Terriglobales bacterium]
MKKIFPLLAGCAVFITLASAEQNSVEQVDPYVRSEIQKQRIPGLALGVYRAGEIIKAQGYGLANVELSVPVHPDTIFQSGSVGKQFTATAIMMLVEEGKLGLDDSIRKYFPEAPATWQNVKIRNLLSHTSGLGEYESDERTKPGGPINMRADYTEDQLVKIIETFPLDFQPGEKWAYRNTNYVLLGVLIHKLTGQFYGDFLQQRIFKPLSMTSTRIISEADIIPSRSAGYRLVKGELKNQEWVSPTMNSTADGALYFNVLDLANWDAALYTEKLLKRSTLDQMWTIARLNNGKENSDNYGFAWAIDKMNGHTVLEHAGAWQGFTTYIARYINDRLTVVVLTNLDSAHSNPKTIAHHVAGFYDPDLTPPELKPIADKEPQVGALLKATLEEIIAGKARPEKFTAEFRASLFPSGVEDLAAELKALGSLQSLVLVERKDEDNLRSYTYRGTFSETQVLIEMALDSDNRIGDLSLSRE